MKIRLERFAQVPGMGTYGCLHIAGERLFTVEREWLDNVAFSSCIATGDYVLKKHKYRGDFDTFAIVGGTVSQYQQEGYERFACVFHVANKPEELCGCIGLGLSPAVFNKKWGVANSAVATERFLEILWASDDDVHTLEITSLGG